MRLKRIAYIPKMQTFAKHSDSAKSKTVSGYSIFSLNKDPDLEIANFQKNSNTNHQCEPPSEKKHMKSMETIHEFLHF